MNRNQCKAARGLLGWSQAQLAAESSLSEAVVTSFETGHREPSKASLKALRARLVVAGVIFIDEADGYGVKLRKSGDSAVAPEEIQDRPPITSIQARMARAGLGLSQPDAAAALGVGLSMLRGFDVGAITPHKRNVAKIQAGYESLGARFFHDGDRYAVSFNAATRLQI